MATTIDTTNNPLAAYGYNQSDGQQLAQSLGLTTQQVADAFAATPLTGGGPADQGNQYGKSAGASLPGRDIQATIQQLQVAKAAGIGQQQAAAPSGTQVQGTGAADPANATNLLGAQALRKVGLNPTNTMTVNQQPGAGPTAGSQFAKTGVSPVTGPTTYSIAGQADPQTATPSIFNAAPTPQPTSQANPLTPAQQPGSSPYVGVSQAPPPAPGMSSPQVPISQPPNTQVPPAPGGTQLVPGIPSGQNPEFMASHPEFTDGAMHAIATAALGHSPAGPPLNAGGGASTSPLPIHRASGGMVHGQPGPDQVPAMLTDGEFVMNRGAVNRIGPAKLAAMNSPKHYASGGYVSDDDDDGDGNQYTGKPDRPIPKPLNSAATPAAGATIADLMKAYAQRQSGQTPATTAPSAPGGGMDIDQLRYIANRAAGQTMQQNAALGATAYPNATTPAAQGYAAAANSGQVTGGAPGAGTIQSAAAMTPAQTQGSMAQANMGAGMAGSAIGAVGQAAQQVAQGLAKSVPSWRMQPSAIPDPNSFKQQMNDYYQRFNQMTA